MIDTFACSNFYIDDGGRIQQIPVLPGGPFYQLLLTSTFMSCMRDMLSKPYFVEGLIVKMMDQHFTLTDQVSRNHAIKSNLLSIVGFINFKSKL